MCSTELDFMLRQARNMKSEIHLSGCYSCPLQMQLGWWARYSSGIWRILVVRSNKDGTFKINATNEGVQ